VGSPCINVCRLDPVSGYCLGCWRDLDEIAAWSTLDAAARRAIWLTLPARERAGHRPAPTAPPTPEADR
jgi:predicted Fe-S protein YdhL (DUF1289 family)